jgi:cell division control protein 11
MKPIDIELMKQLAPRVNIIPIIAKSDTLSPRELTTFKNTVLGTIKQHGIPVFDFPYDEDEDDEEFIEDCKELYSLVPFAVVGADAVKAAGGRRMRCREYPWGVVEVDNPKHCDFGKLRYMLLNSHLQSLRETTHDVLYENYRTQKLSNDGQIDPYDSFDY